MTRTAGQGGSPVGALAPKQLVDSLDLGSTNSAASGAWVHPVFVTRATHETFKPLNLLGHRMNHEPQSVGSSTLDGNLSQLSPSPEEKSTATGAGDAEWRHL